MDYNKNVLEGYLTRLERSLGRISVSERAEIITEIKSHIMDSLARESQGGLDEILRSLGEPETVANRYLLERGLAPQKPPRHPMVKWLVIGFLGTFGIFTLGVIGILMFLTPLVEVNEQAGKVRILGGMIDIKADPKSMHGIGEEIEKAMQDVEVSVKKGEKEIHLQLNEEGRELHLGRSKGKLPIKSEQKDVRVEFSNGEFRVGTSSAEEVSWDCEGAGVSDGSGDAKTEKSGVHLNFSGRWAIECDLLVPKNSRLSLSGANGKIELREPAFSVDSKLVNGVMNFQPDPLQKYRYDVSVQNGRSLGFQGKSASDGLLVKLNVINGDVRLK